MNIFDRLRELRESEFSRANFTKIRDLPQSYAPDIEEEYVAQYTAINEDDRLISLDYLFRDTVRANNIAGDLFSDAAQVIEKRDETEEFNSLVHEGIRLIKRVEGNCSLMRKLTSEAGRIRKVDNLSDDIQKLKGEYLRNLLEFDHFSDYANILQINKAIIEGNYEEAARLKKSMKHETLEGIDWKSLEK